MKRNPLNALYSIVMLLFIAVSAFAQKERKVAVFDPVGTLDKALLEIVREEISSAVVNISGYTVLERQLINKVLEENSFQESGLVSDEQVSNIGKLMGADYVFVTTMSFLGANYYISCKMIEVASARIDRQSTGTTANGMNDIPQTTQNIVKRLFEGQVSQPLATRQNYQPVQTAAAQRDPSGQSKFKVGLRAGFNLTNVTYKTDVEIKNPPDWDYGYDHYFYMPCFQIGLVGEYEIKDYFAVQPGIIFSMQGYKYKNTYRYIYTSDYERNNSPTYYDKSTYNYNYIQVPINLLYKLDLGRSKFLLQAGPYFGFAIGGKYKIENSWSYEYLDPDIYKDGSEKIEGDIEFGSEKDETKPLDYGIGFGFGFQFGKMQVTLGSNLGLADFNNSEQVTTKHYGFNFTLTYLFGK